MSEPGADSIETTNFLKNTLPSLNLTSTGFSALSICTMPTMALGLSPTYLKKIQLIMNVFTIYSIIESNSNPFFTSGYVKVIRWTSPSLALATNVCLLITCVALWWPHLITRSEFTRHELMHDMTKSTAIAFMIVMNFKFKPVWGKFESINLIYSWFLTKITLRPK